MSSYFRSPLTSVWSLLSTITLVSWWLGTQAGSHPNGLNATSAAVVVLIACVKSRLVIRNFMEVARAPIWLRATSDSWLALTFGMIASFYFLSR